MDHETTTGLRHADKKVHLKQGAAGVRIEHRTGDTGYVAYCLPRVITHTRENAGAYETILCRIGDSVLTIEGRNLAPIMEDLCNQRCALLQESDSARTTTPILPYLAKIILQPWL